MDTEDNVQMDWNTLSSVYQMKEAIAHKEIFKILMSLFVAIFFVNCSYII